MLIELEFAGLRKVISGGQCGADRGGLEAAKALGVQTGGTAPKGYRTAYGLDEELKLFGLVEHYCSSYPPRTKANIKDSDATIIVASNPDSAGTALTQRLARANNKPFHVITLPIINREQVIERAVHFIKKNAASTINVAGNRDSGVGQYANFHLIETTSIVKDILLALDAEGLLIKRAS